MVKGAVISSGSTSSQWIIEAMKKYFDEVDDINIKNLEVELGAKQAKVLYEGKPLKKYDCMYPKGSFRYAQLQQSITMFSNDKTYLPIKASTFTSGHNKLLTQIRLQQAGIPMPKTWVTSTPEAAKELLEKINYPIIMKFPEGTQGTGVMFADSYPSASSVLDAFSALKVPLIIQEYIETDGTDIRAIVVGDKVVAAMYRKAEKGEKRANIHAGGSGEAAELDTLTKRVAVKTAQTMGCDICAVDILMGSQGPMVIEINLAPGLQGITKATGIDVADKIAKFLFDKSKTVSDKTKQEGHGEIFKEMGIESAEVQPKVDEIVTTLDFRGERVLLPSSITKLAKMKEEDEYSIKIEDGKLIIKKFKL